MTLRTIRVKVSRYFWSLTIQTNNFVFEIKVMLDLESTIPDGWPAGWTEKLEIEPATAQLEPGLWLSLATKKMKVIQLHE